MGKVARAAGASKTRVTGARRAIGCSPSGWGRRPADAALPDPLTALCWGVAAVAVCEAAPAVHVVVPRVGVWLAAERIGVFAGGALETSAPPSADGPEPKRTTPNGKARIYTEGDRSVGEVVADQRLIGANLRPVQELGSVARFPLGCSPSWLCLMSTAHPGVERETEVYGVNLGGHTKGPPTSHLLRQISFGCPNAVRAPNGDAGAG